MHGLTEDDSRRLIHDLREENRSLLAGHRSLQEEVDRLERATATARGEGLAVGEKRERARIRQDFTAWLDAQDDAGGELEDRFLAALDRIIPEAE